MLKTLSKVWFNGFAMKTTEAIHLFGNIANLARALNISVQAVYQWGDTVPELRTYQIRDMIASGAISGDGDETKEAA